MQLISTPLTTFDRAIQSEIKVILGKLKLHLENKDLGLNRIKKQNHPERVCAPLVEECDVYGRDDDKKTILKLLLSGESSHDKLGVIPIVGMGGIGKTTLAQLVYNDQRVNQKFDTKVWVTVGDEDRVDSSKVIKKIIQKVANSEKCQLEERFELLEKVKIALTGKKFLIVLDDVWDEDRNRWEVIKSTFISGLCGSKIIVTTRSNIVASIMETGSIHCLKGVSCDDSWRLFANCASVVDVNDADECSDLHVIGRQIVDKCKGLPLAIKSLGGLLRGKQNKEDWDDILNNDIWELYDRKSVGILPALWMSYFYLPSYLKPCFAYCAIFSKDYEFEKEDIILLWMAEDLLHSNNKEKRIEEVGEEYFKELISRSFFQPSSKDESIFLMHDLMHDLAMFVSGEFCLAVHEYTNLSSCTHKIRHLSYRQEKGQAHDSEFFEDLSQIKGLRTFLMLSEKWCFPSGMEHLLELLLSTRGCLRVLSMADRSVTKLPNSLGNLKYLRYLKLDYPEICEIPNTICNLYNLETLLLERCYKLTQLPTNIGNLIKLRHLCVPFVLEEMPLQIGKVVGQNRDFGIKLLKELPNLHGTIRIMGLENVSSVEDVLEANLKNKKFLSQLVLEWGDGHEPTNNDTQLKTKLLGALEPHVNLKALYINGYKGSSYPNWVGDPLFSNVVRVTLWNCKNCRFLPPLGQLPSLKDISIRGFDSVVRIKSEFYYSTSVNSHAATNTKPFKSLERLSFAYMKEFREWSFIEGEDFPRLKKLRFIVCRRLELSLPDIFPSLR
ncbi:putative disease resistance RPP13-like protein 1 [Humulus lupulus]|uniref:putative disease resistance RPP13-like protein 1 n=1 Tax=Humulus lupulus TaxID=3486 RepID=UPI002B40E363|nr:putative disease resistance RPP13-like protein 1 [Humulus lupulus]